MKKKVVLITAGPTKEYIDPIRFISNDSSGKMGYLLAEESKKLGDVILISGPTCLKPPKGIKFIKVISASEMFNQVKKYFNKCDVFISCAAVSDYKVNNASKDKIKKTIGKLKLELISNPDILLEVSKEKYNNKRILVGFALETNNLIKNAQNKFIKKKLDIIIANEPSTINSDRSKGAIITEDKIKKFKSISKKSLAEIIIGDIRGVLTR